MTALTTYRFFTLNAGGDVIADRSLGFLNDDEARAMAATLCGGDVTIEVWDIARLVGSVAVVH